MEHLNEAFTIDAQVTLNEKFDIDVLEFHDFVA